MPVSICASRIESRTIIESRLAYRWPPYWRGGAAVCRSLTCVDLVIIFFFDRFRFVQRMLIVNCVLTNEKLKLETFVRSLDR